MGCANIAKRSVIPAIINNHNYKLVAVASRSESKAKEFASLFNTKPIIGYDKLLDEDIDAVYMPLPTGLHEEWVLKCLDKGKHVYIEKSFAINLSVAHNLLDKAKQRKCIVKENFMFPYHSQNKFLLKLLNDKVIGDIRSFQSSFCFPPLASDNFRYNKNIGGGALLDAGAYPVKAAQMVFGNKIKHLSSTMNLNEAGVDITGSAHFISKGNIPIHLTWGFDNFYQCKIEILGTHGKIITNRSFTAGLDFKPSITLEFPNEIKELSLSSDNHFDNILNSFYANIINEEFEECVNEAYNQSFMLNEILTKSIVNEC